MEFLDELDLSAYALAKALRVPTNRVTGIVERRARDHCGYGLADARCFGAAPEFWLNLQTHYDLTVARRRDTRRIEREVERLAQLWAN